MDSENKASFDVYKTFKDNNCCIENKITIYNSTIPVEVYSGSITHPVGMEQISLNSSLWKVDYSFSAVDSNMDAVDGVINFKLIKGNSAETGMSINILFDKWAKENYVLIPSAVYDGNRFRVSGQSYPPMLVKKEENGVDIPVTITDVPRLNIGEGNSEIQLTTGDMSTPAVGFYSPRGGRGFFMLFPQETILGNHGVSIKENDERTRAVFSLSTPSVRQEYKYSMCTTKEISDDRGHEFNENDEVTIRFRLYFFDCADITDLFDYFVKIRKDLTGNVTIHHEIPFSAAWEIEEKKHNERNWSRKYGFYTISESDSDSVYGQWQTGWVGGAMSTYPFLFEGNCLSRERAWSTLDFVFDKIQVSSGFFYGMYYKDKPYGDNYRDHANINWVLIRKNADAIYFLVKQFMFIEKDGLTSIPDHWHKGLKRACDAFIRLWKKHGQFGQFIDIEKEEIIIGGTACAGIAAAGLTLAGRYFENFVYLDIAEQAADYYYKNFTKKGITNGAPGEACQCPDSESAFGLLESYVTLYEVTGSRKYLKMAEDAAKQCSTWCVSYDYNFPKESEFYKLAMHTAGAVWANVQNKHAAPGICTLSGLSLFKLYRATGNVLYLELIQEIAHNIPQYISREDRPIRISWNKNKGSEYNLIGRINERINMSDWEGKQNIGALPDGSNWCEVSNMLTFVEIPGVYIQKDTGFVYAIDHVDVETVENDENIIVVEIKNPTAFMAKVKLFVENSNEISKPMGENALYGAIKVIVEPFGSERISFIKNIEMLDKH